MRSILDPVSLILRSEIDCVSVRNCSPRYNRAKARYQEVVDLVYFGKSCLNIFTENEYFEASINPQSGDDWNQTKPVDTRPTLADFKKTVGDYLAWEVSKLLQSGDVPGKKR